MIQEGMFLYKIVNILAACSLGGCSNGGRSSAPGMNISEGNDSSPIEMPGTNTNVSFSEEKVIDRYKDLNARFVPPLGDPYSIRSPVADVRRGRDLMGAFLADWTSFPNYSIAGISKPVVKTSGVAVYQLSLLSKIYEPHRNRVKLEDLTVLVVSKIEDPASLAPLVQLGWSTDTQYNLKDFAPSLSTNLVQAVLSKLLPDERLLAIKVWEGFASPNESFLFTHAHGIATQFNVSEIPPVFPSDYDALLLSPTVLRPLDPTFVLPVRHVVFSRHEELVRNFMGNYEILPTYSVAASVFRQAYGGLLAVYQVNMISKIESGDPILSARQIRIDCATVAVANASNVPDMLFWVPGALTSDDWLALDAFAPTNATNIASAIELQLDPSELILGLSVYTGFGSNETLIFPSDYSVVQTTLNATAV